MNIKELNVPKGIRYISQWQDFKLPEEPTIIDKQIPGCGFTEYCITNPDNIILVSPRKILLENKRDQHEEDVYLVKSILQELGVDFDFSAKAKKRKYGFIYENPIIVAQREKEEKEAKDRNNKRIRDEVSNYVHIRFADKKPCKILVTYDSYRKVKETLINLGVFEEFYTVIDEFQSIFVDSRFKSDTEIEFLSALRGVEKACYVSATPMIQEYLEELDEFKDLPYIKFNWEKEDASRVSPPGLETYVLRSLTDVTRNIISDYREGRFETAVRVLDNGETELVQSKEAVIYVNSVNNICNIIRLNSLEPEEVNILCADTPDNRSRIKRKIGSNYLIGKVPTKNEPRKMFTLCTRTVYLGADFYSDNARSFIISDANVEALAVDITLDLPQILGRQRLDINPWKNKAIIYARTLAKDNEMSKEHFDSIISEKDQATAETLENFAAVPNKGREAKILEDRAIDRKYSDDYVAVNKHDGKAAFPVINKLVRISERRAFDIQQKDYKDRFSVFTRIFETFNLDKNESNLNVAEFLNSFSEAKNQKEKMKLLCEIDEITRSRVVDLIPQYYKNFIEALGPDKCKSLSYDYVRMKAAMSVKYFDKNKLVERIGEEFHEGDRIARVDIKERLAKIYDELKYQKSAKANDLEEWFEVKECRIPNLITNKRDLGYELLRKKF